MIEIEGNLTNQFVYVLIDPGASLSYVGPQIVGKCKLKTEKYRTTWLVKLAIGTKIRVTSHVKQCQLNLNGYLTIVDLNLLPLGSHEILIGMP